MARRRIQNTEQNAPMPSRALRNKPRVNYTIPDEDEADKHMKQPTPKLLDSRRIFRKSARNQRNQPSDSSSCPLLELPAEIRNRIWELALGGETIHVWYGHGWIPGEDPEPPVYRADCIHAATPQEEADAIQAKSISVAGTEYTAAIRFITRHHDCKHSPTQQNKHRLALLRTCSQIHMEAALLPFALNTFLFDHHIDLFHFLNRLIPQQALAIQHVSMCLSRCADHDGYDTQISVQNQELFKKKLRHLDSLVLFGEFFPDEDVGDGEMWMRQNGGMVFKLLEIEQVKVMGYLWFEDEAGWEDVNGALTKGELQEWAKDLEVELKKDWVTIEREAKKNTGKGWMEGLKERQALENLYLEMGWEWDFD